MEYEELIRLCFPKPDDWAECSKDVEMNTTEQNLQPFPRCGGITHCLMNMFKNKIPANIKTIGVMCPSDLLNGLYIW